MTEPTPVGEHGAVRVRVYTASKTRHAPMWQAFRTTWAEVGVSVVSTWIDEAGEGETDDLSDLWTRCIAEASGADFLVCYHEDGDVWKGCFIEVGSALSHCKPVYLIANDGPPPGWSWVHHPLVTLASDPDDALCDYLARDGRGTEGRRCERCADTGNYPPTSANPCSFCGGDDG